MVSSRGPKSRHWCFTLNNYTPEDVDRLSNIAELTDVQYIVFGREVGNSGTPHLQGYVCFLTGKRKQLSRVISIIGQAHCSVASQILRSIAYCKKDGDFSEFGTAPETDERNESQQKDNDAAMLLKFKEAVKSGIFDMKILRDDHSQVCAKHPKFVREYVTDWKPKPTVETFELRNWQSTLYATLNQPIDPRKIHFIVDAVGNNGKSWFARYYRSLHNDCQIILPSKKADMAYALEEDKRVYIFDCPRSKQGEFIQYDFLEEVKNGNVFSPKFESKSKEFNTPHVVVMMNEPPDMSKLSVDRYSITTLN